MQIFSAFLLASQIWRLWRTRSWLLWGSVGQIAIILRTCALSKMGCMGRCQIDMIKLCAPRKNCNRLSRFAFKHWEIMFSLSDRNMTYVCPIASHLSNTVQEVARELWSPSGSAADLLDEVKTSGGRKWWVVRILTVASSTFRPAEYGFKMIRAHIRIDIEYLNHQNEALSSEIIIMPIGKWFVSGVTTPSHRWYFPSTGWTLVNGVGWQSKVN